MAKYGHRTLKWFEAIVNKLGGEEAAERFLRGELAIAKPERKWREEDGVIYFNLTSDGTTGSEWISRLEGVGYRLSKYAKDLLISPDFVPTNGLIYEIGVMKGMLWNDADRVTKNIRLEAEKRGFTKPNAEVACLIRANFTDSEIEAMGLWWLVAMHEPIKDSDGDPSLLEVGRGDDGRWLRAPYGKPGLRWDRGVGFAFVGSQVSA